VNFVARASLGIVVAATCVAAVLAVIHLVRGRGMKWLVGVEESSHRALAMVFLGVWALLALLPWVLRWHPFSFCLARS